MAGKIIKMLIWASTWKQCKKGTRPNISMCADRARYPTYPTLDTLGYYYYYYYYLLNLFLRKEKPIYTLGRVGKGTPSSSRYTPAIVFSMARISLISRHYTLMT